MTMVTRTDAPTTCSARVGFYADEWAEMPLACSASVGITRYTDKHGIERAYCRHHQGVVLYRYPMQHNLGCPERAGVGDCDEWESRKSTIDAAILADPERP